MNEHEDCVDLRPPVGTDIRCPKCKQSVEYVHVHADDDHAHAMPCGCKVTVPDMYQMIGQSKAWQR